MTTTAEPSQATPAEPPPWQRLVESSPATRSRPPTSTRRVVGQFLAASIAAAILLVAGSVWVSREAAKDEAIDDARRTADLLATSIVEPALDDDLLEGDDSDLRKIDDQVHRYLLDNGNAVRVKIWTPDGRIVYSDEPRLIGNQYTLGDDEREALVSGETEAELSDLAGPENRYEREQGRQLLEVYRPIRGPDGQVLLFEMYAKYDDVTSNGGKIWRRFAPVTIGSLLLLAVLQLPLAWRMTRQLREAQRERYRLLQRAAAASDDERRRIAGHLHDGVVQDLAGASFVLAGVVDGIGKAAAPAPSPAPAAEPSGTDAPEPAPDPSSADAAPPLRRALHAVRESIAGLRSLLVEIYPPNLSQAGLPAALAGAAVPLTARGVTVSTHVPEDLDLPPAVEALVFRIAQEALRNVAKHARARTVEVRVDRAPTSVVLLVCDDGDGFDLDAVRDKPATGHFGLSVLTDLAADAGAILDLATAPGRGTRLRLEVPLP